MATRAQFLMEDYERMRHCKAENKRYSAYCEVDLHEVIGLDADEFNAMLSERTTDTPVMQHVFYEVVDRKGIDTLVLRVTGFVDEAVDLIESQQLGAGV